MSHCYDRLSMCIILGMMMLHPFSGRSQCGSAMDSIEKKQYATALSDLIHKNTTTLHPRNEVNIQIVFNVVQKEGEIPITYQEIIQQIDNLNQAFSQSDIDLTLIPEEFQDIVGTGAIHFCLAKMPMDGAEAVIRKSTISDEIGITDAVFTSEGGGIDATEPEKYLNIWIADMGDYLAGKSSYPWSEIPIEERGIVINSRNFIHAGVNSKTLIHEVGHFFGLIHLWGDDSDCATDDNIQDTPNQIGPNYGCPNYPKISCDNVENTVNFMDYLDDECMLMFTKGQISRMFEFMYEKYSTMLQDICNCESSGKEFDFVVIPSYGNGLYKCRIQSENSNKQNYSVYNTMGELLQKGAVSGSEFTIDLTSAIGNMFYIKIENKIYKVLKY